MPLIIDEKEIGKIRAQLKGAPKLRALLGKLTKQGQAS
jgi:hypothetical protein